MEKNDIPLRIAKISRHDYFFNFIILEVNHITTSYSNPKGNADTERFMRTFFNECRAKEELIYINKFDSFDEAKKAADEFMKFYNQDYPRSALGKISPVEFENF